MNCWFMPSLTVLSIAPVCTDSENFHSLSLQNAVCWEQWRIMVCLVERCLSSGLLLPTALIKDCKTPPCDSGSVWENAGADFFHWSLGHSFDLVPAARSRCWPSSSPSPLCCALLDTDKCSYTVSLMRVLHCNHFTLETDSDLRGNCVMLLGLGIIWILVNPILILFLLFNSGP